MAADQDGDVLWWWSCEKVRSLKSNLEANADLRQEVLNANVTGEELGESLPHRTDNHLGRLGWR